MTENEYRILIRDYFNDTYKEQEILNKLDLVKCKCGNVELEEDIENDKCEECRNGR